MKRTIRQQLALGTFTLGLLATAACGSDASKSESASKTDPISTTQNSSTDSTEPTTNRECDSIQFNSIPDAVRAATSFLGDGKLITSTELDDVCGVAVQTSLTTSADDAETAKVICGYAGSESFTAGAKTVQVFSSDKTLLATGTKDEVCTVKA